MSIMPGRAAAAVKPCMAFPRTTPERIEASRFSVCKASLKRRRPERGPAASDFKSVVLLLVACVDALSALAIHIGTAGALALAAGAASFALALALALALLAGLFVALLLFRILFRNGLHEAAAAYL